MRVCDACGASNPAEARWCSQCYADLGAAASGAPSDPVPPSDPAAASDPIAPSDPAAPTDPVPAGDDRAARGREPRPDTGLRRGAAGLEWECVACLTANPLAASTCAACGLPFTARFAVAQRPAPVDWPRARLASLVLPGAGHLLAGEVAGGLARILLFVVWGLGGILVLTGAGSDGLLVAAPLLGGAIVVHALTQRDLGALQRGGAPLLAGRVLLGLVGAVTVLLLLGVVVGLTGLGGGDPGGPA